VGSEIYEKYHLTESLNTCAEICIDLTNMNKYNAAETLKGGLKGLV